MDNGLRTSLGFSIPPNAPLQTASGAAHGDFRRQSRPGNPAAEKHGCGFGGGRRANARQLVPRTCDHCREPFVVARKRVKAGRGRFCSLACAYASRVGQPAPGFVTPESERQQRLAANGLVNKRLKLGWFAKPTRCMKCGRKGRLDSHHTDYAKPDHVFWLCRSCHMRVHRDASLLDGLAPFVCDQKIPAWQRAERREAKSPARFSRARVAQPVTPAAGRTQPAAEGGSHV